MHTTSMFSFLPFKYTEESCPKSLQLQSLQYIASLVFLSQISDCSFHLSNMCFLSVGPCSIPVSKLPASFLCQKKQRNKKKWTVPSFIIEDKNQNWRKHHIFKVVSLLSCSVGQFTVFAKHASRTRRPHSLKKQKHVSTNCYSCYRVNKRLKWSVKDMACQTKKTQQCTRKIWMDEVIE